MTSAAQSYCSAPKCAAFAGATAPGLARSARPTYHHAQGWNHRKYYPPCPPTTTAPIHTTAPTLTPTQHRVSPLPCSCLLHCSTCDATTPIYHRTSPQADVPPLPAARTASHPKRTFSAFTRGAGPRPPCSACAATLLPTCSRRSLLRANPRAAPSSATPTGACFAAVPSRFPAPNLGS